MYSEEAIESKLEIVEFIFKKCGAEPLNINVKNREKFGQRVIYLYKNMYYRTDHLKFDDDERHYIVISCTKDEKFANIGLLDDIEALPFEMTEHELENEIRKILDEQE